MADKVFPLNSVRIFISLLVVFHHSTRIFIPAIAASAAQPGHYSFFTEFSVRLSFSASFFFLLSGYTLSCAYLRKGRAIDIRRFSVARFARLYPLYLLVFLIEGAIYLRPLLRGKGMIGSAEILAANGLLLQSWYPEKLLLINDPSWALSAEIFFCICFTLLGSRLWKLSGARLWLTALALYLGGQAFVWAFGADADLNWWSFWPPFHVSTFFLGVLVARWLSLQKERKEPGGVRAWQANSVLGISIAALLVCVQLETLSPGRIPYTHGLLAPIFTAIIWSLTVTPTAVTRWLAGKWMVALGNASYALYLIHVPILKLFVRFGLVATHFYPVFFAVCVGLSLVSSRFFEAPIRSWMMEQFEARRFGRAVEERSIAYSEGVGD